MTRTGCKVNMDITIREMTKAITFLYAILLMIVEITQATLPGERFYSKSACYGFEDLFNIMNGTCATGNVLAIEAVIAGTKNESLGCPAELPSNYTEAMYQTCCTPDNRTDCTAIYSMPSYQQYFNGKTSFQLRATRDLLTCDRTFFQPSVSSYMFVQYFCVNEASIIDISSPGITTIANDAVYIWMGFSESSGVTRSSNCSIEIDNCAASIRIFTIHMELGNTTDACETSLQLVDIHANTLLQWNCSHTPTKIIEETVAATYVVLVLNNAALDSSGKFWLGFMATESANVSINCPRQQQVNCDKPTSVALSTTTTTPNPTTTSTASTVTTTGVALSTTTTTPNPVMETLSTSNRSILDSTTQHSTTEAQGSVSSDAKHLTIVVIVLALVLGILITGIIIWGIFMQREKKRKLNQNERMEANSNDDSVMIISGNLPAKTQYKSHKSIPFYSTPNQNNNNRDTEREVSNATYVQQKQHITLETADAGHKQHIPAQLQSKCSQTDTVNESRTTACQTSLTNLQNETASTDIYSTMVNTTVLKSDVIELLSKECQTEVKDEIMGIMKNKKTQTRKHKKRPKSAKTVISTECQTESVIQDMIPQLILDQLEPRKNIHEEAVKTSAIKVSLHNSSNISVHSETKNEIDNTLSQQTSPINDMNKESKTFISKNTELDRNGQRQSITITESTFTTYRDDNVVKEREEASSRSTDIQYSKQNGTTNRYEIMFKIIHNKTIGDELFNKKLHGQFAKIFSKQSKRKQRHFHSISDWNTIHTKSQLLPNGNVHRILERNSNKIGCT